MKSYNLVIFTILILFVFDTKASVFSQVNETMKIYSGGFKVWLKEVDGYERDDQFNGYSGIFYEPITSIRIGGGQPYTVHIYNYETEVKNKQYMVNGWYEKTSGSDQQDVNGYAGTVNGILKIDGISIADDVEYSVHIMGEDWLEPIHGTVHDLDGIPALYENRENLTLGDPKQFAGIIGKPIDAIMVKGRKYATSFFSNNKCKAHGGTCMDENECKGKVVKEYCYLADQVTLSDFEGKDELCPVDKPCGCCLTYETEKSDPTTNNENNNGKNSNDNTLLITFIVIILIILAILVIALILRKHSSNSKKWINKVVSTSVRETQNNEDVLPSYDEAVNDQRNNEENNEVVINNVETNEEAINNIENDEESIKEQDNEQNNEQNNDKKSIENESNQPLVVKIDNIHNIKKLK